MKMFRSENVEALDQLKLSSQFIGGKDWIVPNLNDCLALSVKLREILGDDFIYLERKCIDRICFNKKSQRPLVDLYRVVLKNVTDL